VLGLRLDEVRALTNRLNADFSADAWEYAQLGDIPDEVQRTTASDQIHSAARGIEQNLVEARLNELDVAGLVGPNGLSMPYAGREHQRPPPQRPRRDEHRGVLSSLRVGAGLHGGRAHRRGTDTYVPTARRHGTPGAVQPVRARQARSRGRPRRTPRSVDCAHQAPRRTAPPGSRWLVRLGTRDAERHAAPPTRG
jgi:hypothetical protein